MGLAAYQVGARAVIMELTTETMEETLMFLIKNADPQGLNHKKLVRIYGQVKRNVFIGPSARAFIAKCVAKFDNIECDHLREGDGRCKIIKGAPQCTHKERYELCGKYKQAKELIKGNPIRLGG